MSKVYYFTPDFDWEVSEEETGIGYWADVNAENIESVIEGQEDCVEIYTVKGFLDAFNSEEISDEGFAVLI